MRRSARRTRTSSRCSATPARPILDPLELPDTAPVVLGEIAAPDGAPTVLLYSHYDVVPVGDESKWESPPFEATERDGAIFGRGAADTKSNILMHVGALRAWDGKPPVGIKVVIEGMEEVGSAFSTFPPSRPELFAADAMVIGDMGSFRPGVPTLTVALRGTASVVVEARTLAGPKHSGQFGGAAPDALIALLHAIASLHDERGDVTVPGLRREEWTGASYSDDEFRELAEVEDGLPFFGTGGLGERIWTGPVDHRHRHGRAAGRPRRQRGRPVRTGEAQPARASRAGRRRGPVRARRVPRGPAPVRHQLHGVGARDGQGVRGEDVGHGLRRGARRAPGRLGRASR